MKPVKQMCALLSITCLIMLATASVAWAHVVVTPKEAPTDSFQKFVVTVPTEKDIPTTEQCIQPFHDSEDLDYGGPHGARDAVLYIRWR